MCTVTVPSASSSTAAKCSWVKVPTRTARSPFMSSTKTTSPPHWTTTQSAFLDAPCHVSYASHPPPSTLPKLFNDVCHQVWVYILFPKKNIIQSAGLFSESYQKALKAGQVSLLADDTMNTCLQRVEEAVHNSTFNHGVKPQYNVAPPALLRTLAAQATKGEAPRKVQGSIDRDEATTGISLCGQAVSIKELRLLCEALADPATNIDLLDLQQCLDVKGKPAIPHDEIEFESEAIQRQWGTVTLEEGDEKGDKLRAAIAPVELVSVEQGFRQLAKSQLNRMDMVCLCYP